MTAIESDLIKRKLSLAFVKVVDKLISPSLSDIYISHTDQILFELRDKLSPAQFYFIIENEGLNNSSELEITFNCKPWSETEKQSKGSKFPIPMFEKKLEEWLRIIHEFKTHELFVDPTEKQFQEEFYADFKIVDDDASSRTFNFSQQLLLNGYVTNLLEYIQSDESELSIEDKTELFKHSDNLKEAIRVETKDGYIKKQSLFWAKMRKKSLKACEFALKEFAKEFIKEVAKTGMQISWESLPHYIDQLRNLLT